MKTVYRYHRRSGNVRSSALGFTSNALRNWQRAVLVTLTLAGLLFTVSCLMVVSDSQIGSAVASRRYELKAPPGQAPRPPGLYAEAAVLMDAESGRLLYEKNAHLKLPMASTTKMMTALVVRENLKLDEPVTVSKEAADVGEQEIWLEPGETVSVEDLLWALLVQSANDAAFALAERAGGSVAAFTEMMNSKARSIGATESQFKNPHGLDEPGHYSTACDLALIGRELMKDPVLARMAGTRQHEIPWPGHPGGRVAVSHNELLGAYQGANGIKTGYTLGAGWCLVASASRDDTSLIAVALNSSHRADDTAALFNYGFAYSRRIVMVRRGEKLGTARISTYPRRYVNAISERELGALSLQGSDDVFVITATVTREAKTPLEKGQKLGTLMCRLNGAPLYRENAVSPRAVQKPMPMVGVFYFIWYAVCWTGRIITAPFRLF